MQIKTLEQTSIAEITDTFNTAFAGYFVKLHVTEEQLKQRLIAEGIDLGSSIGAYDNNRLAGFILNGFDTVNGVLRSYNAGTGVIPAYRGKGLTNAMYAKMLPMIRSKGV